ncbi:MAG: type II toxin-antitoxin system HicA family toxin [Candidatus Magasanikbacteria bacterium]|nr:type II toxin-antitoxin system HicA family toxin [Candidatus Magasanikbacteria bacterium]
MVGRYNNFSGHGVIKILQKQFGFVFVSQKGSHIKLRKIDGEKVITVIIPAHRELAEGTLHNILRQAEVEPESFLRFR